MDLDEKVSLLLSKQAFLQEDVKLEQSGEKVETAGIYIDDDDMDLTDPRNIHQYIRTAKGSAAFEELTLSLQKAAIMMQPAARNVRQEIWQNVFRALPGRLAAYTCVAPHDDLVYTSSWDPFAFHATQEYTCSISEMLDRAITLTGYGDNVQAISSRDYVSQVWGALGVSVLQALKTAVNTPDKTLTQELTPRPAASVSDGDPTVEALFQSHMLYVRARGIPHLVAEIGEILGWIIAALAASLSEQLATVIPSVARPRKLTQADRDIFESCGLDCTGLIYTTAITLELSQVEPLQDGSANCWHAMFRNPAIVEGYPILRRPKSGTGLQIPAAMMASLTNASYLVDFYHWTVLKGFSTMLVVSEVLDRTVHWHLVCKANR